MSVQDIPVLFLRLEGPMQSWGLQSRHVVRDTGLEPTKSGVIGLIACCFGRRRGEPLDDLAALRMAVRIDRPGLLWRDYHTVGAKGHGQASLGNRAGLMAANRKIKIHQQTAQPETLVSHRFYLCDASFLVAITAGQDLLDRIEGALKRPHWPPFLGRKSCPPAVPIFVDRGEYRSLLDALKAQTWCPRLEDVDLTPDNLRCVIECEATDPGAEIRFDCPTSFAEPRRMEHRYVRTVFIDAFTVGAARQAAYHAPESKRVTYRPKSRWQALKHARGILDDYLCVFCKMPYHITHHVTYERADHEHVDDLRSVCRRCHDALIMLESEREMSLHRIDPLSKEYRELILQKRKQIDSERTIRHDPERR